MLNKKPLLGLAAISIFTTGSAFAQTPNQTPRVTDEVTFSAKVDRQCGIEATDDNADLALGKNYNSTHATVKLVSNNPNGATVKAKKVNIESFDNLIEIQDVHFKSTGTKQEDKNATKWKNNGIRITRDQIRTENELNLFARVNVDESNLDSNVDYEVETQWRIECN